MGLDSQTIAIIESIDPISRDGTDTTLLQHLWETAKNIMISEVSSFQGGWGGGSLVHHPIWLGPYIVS